MRGLFPLALALLLGTGMSPHAHAAPGKLQSGKYTIYYNALRANALPEVSTRAYGLSRDADQGLVTLAVNRGHADTAANVPFRVSGHASTLLGKPVPLEFRHFDDRQGHYAVLVSFTVPNGETVRFDLDVIPQGGSSTHLYFIHDYAP